jgi:phosphoribosylformylglycinamidine (FGAM) synthase-like amidotransferase family enzyme
MIIGTNPSMIVEENFELDIQEFAIGGKLIKGSLIIPIERFEQLILSGGDSFKDHLKRDLAQRLAEQILKEKFCEITQRDDPVTLTKHIAIRCYLAPHDQVKILRVYDANLHQSRRN